MQMKESRLRQQEIFLISLIVTISLSIFIWDIFSPLGVVTGVAYIGVELITLGILGTRIVIITAAVTTVFTVAGYFLSSHEGILWIGVSNRVISILGIWLTAILILIKKKTPKEYENVASFSNVSPHPVLKVNGEGTLIYANPASEELLRNMKCHVNGVLRADCLKYIQQSRDSGKPVEFQTTASGRYYSMQVIPSSKEDHLYIFAIDISEKKKAEAEASLAVKVFKNTKEGLIVTNPDGVIQYVNPSFTLITGYTAEDAIGKPANLLKSGKHDNIFFKRMWETLAESEEWSGEVWNKRKNGEIYLQRMTITTVKDRDGQIIQYSGLFYDITEKRRHAEDVRYQADHDPLTGLPNRVLFNDRLGQAIARANRYGLLLAIIFLDMDGFKRVNDGFGHSVGDMLLKGVAMRLIGTLRESDTVCRFGGDEFTILLEDIRDAGEAARTADRIVRTLSETYIHEKQEIIVTPSLGVAIFPADSDREEDLLRMADKALYFAKNSGKKCFKLYSPKME